MTEIIDPLKGLSQLTEGVPAAEAAARVRRGLVVHAQSPRPPVGQTPHTVIHRQNKLVVRFYDPETLGGAALAPLPIVVVPSMINRAWICDLEEDRSLVGGLAARGHRTYLVDWGIPGPEDADQGFATVVLGLLRRAVDRACRHAGTDRAILLGYCQGGVLASMLAALRPRRVAGLIALATPVRFQAGGRFAAFCASQVCDPAALVDEEGLVSTEVMGPAFKLLDPMGNWYKFLALEKASADPDRLRRALARERWLEENVPLPGALATEMITHGYQGERLLKGTWPVGDEVVDLSRITVPVLVTPCRRDFITPVPSAAPLAEAVGSDDVTLDVQDTGHIGVVVGSWGPRRFYPLIDRWSRRIAAPVADDEEAA